MRLRLKPGQLGLVSGGGQLLPDAVRGQMETALRADFSNVRIHIGPQAERIGAAAFTIGSAIYFAPGQYQPYTRRGQQLLGHELTHVVQQKTGRVRTVASTGLSVVQDPFLEAEADRMGHLAAMAAAAQAMQLKPLPPVRAMHSRPGRGGALQMTPRDWNANTTITSILGYEGSPQFWQPILARIREYRGLASADGAGRTVKLNQLDAAINAWEQNQATAFVWHTDVRDAKQRELNQLKALIRGERQEMREEERRDQAPTISTPMAISSRGEERIIPLGTSLGSLPEVLPAPLGLRSRVISAEKIQAFQRLHVYLHLTKPEYREGIHYSGLIPGKKQGIGLPSDGDERGAPDPINVYVLSGSVPETTSFVSQEAGDAAIVVVSRQPSYDKDVNYPKGGAYRFGGIPTGRGYTQGNSSICLVLPLTQSAKIGLANFINEGANLHSQITGDEAGILLARKLGHTFPLEFHSYSRELW
jgi:hypothetical protein